MCNCKCKCSHERELQAGDKVECLVTETYGAFRDMTVGKTYNIITATAGYAVWRDDVGDRCSYDLKYLGERFQLKRDVVEFKIHDYLRANNIHVTNEQAEQVAQAALAFARSFNTAGTCPQY